MHARFFRVRLFPHIGSATFLIDYYQDLGAHALLEVIPIAITKSLTDPAQVYVLRWIDGQTSGIPEFNLLYTIT